MLALVTVATILFIGVQYSSTVWKELRKPLHKKWYDLGVKLQIERKVLDDIKTRNTSASPLNQVVMEWLKLNSSLSCLPTWNHLIKAIILMDKEKVAKELQEAHLVTPDTTSGMELWDNNVGQNVYCNYMRAQWK